MIKKFFLGFLKILIAVLCLCVTCFMLLTLIWGNGISESRPKGDPISLAVKDRFQMYITNSISSALEGIWDIKKVYWLSDDDLIAPEPNQELFGTATNPAELEWLLEDAQDILDGQKTLFTTQTKVDHQTEINYYLDETIFVVTWKEEHADTMYTISEIKIAHPSQFRRFLSGGSYGSGIQLMTTQMAESVNAVVASSGDFYAHRRPGITVYNGNVHRVDSEEIDTCFIDQNGDLIFSYRKELDTVEETQKFVDENDIRFSISFGPVLIDDGNPVDFKYYTLGEVVGNYARSALCQMGPLHYVLVTANTEFQYHAMPTLKTFQNVVATFGCEKAYTLDGGQTAAIVMNDKLINRVTFGFQRNISDIIYFATAIPDGE